MKSVQLRNDGSLAQTNPSITVATGQSLQPTGEGVINATHFDGAELDTDPVMSANSDARVPTQAAVVAYVASNSGSGTSNKITVNQNTHGLAAGVAVFDSGGTWQRAKADNIATCRHAAVVESVPDPDHFIVVLSGELDTAGLGWTANTTLYVSATSAGALSATQPTAANHFSVSLVVTGSTTTAYVLPAIPLALNQLNLETDVTGVLPSANGGAGTVSGIMKADGDGTTSAALAGTDYEPARTAVTQEEAEAGTGTTVRGWTPARVAQAIAALSGSGASIPDEGIIIIPDATAIPAGYYECDGTGGVPNLTSWVPAGMKAIQRLVSAPDTTAPTLTGVQIGTNGTTWTLTFDEPVTIGAGGSGGFVATMATAGTVTLTGTPDGDGTTSLVFTSQTPLVYSGDTGTIAYTQPGNGIEDAADNDLASIAASPGVTVDNQSAQSSGPTLIDQDDFTSYGSDVALATTSKWDGVSGTMYIKASGDRVYTGDSAAVANNTATYAANQRSEVRLVGVGASGVGGPAVRCLPDVSYYAFRVAANGAWSIVGKVAGGTTSVITSGTNASLVAGVDLAIEVSGLGSSIVLKAQYKPNGGSWTDVATGVSAASSQINGPGYAGIYATYLSDPNTAGLSNFRGYNL